MSTMQLSIRHTTRYRFDAPASHGVQRLRLIPKSTQGQRVLDWSMHYEGASEQLSYDDQHVNHVTLVAVDEGAREVLVTCEGVVQTEDNAGVIGRHSGHMPMWAFLAQTPLTRPGPRIRQLLGPAPRAGGDTLARLHDLSAAIKAQVRYETGTTHSATTAEEAAAAGHGVCQDHAHIFISAARALEVPARYVSGYLLMDDRVDQEATHAWAEAFVEGLGWVGFDISNGIAPDPRHVRVATGRDYTDAAPITGISFGTLREELHVALAVEQQQIEQ